MLGLKRLKNNYDQSLEYSVYVDDACKGYIDNGKSIKLNVEAGTHKVKVMYDQGSSNEITITLDDKEDVKLICGLNTQTYKEKCLFLNSIGRKKKNVLFLEYETHDSLKIRKTLEAKRGRL